MLPADWSGLQGSVLCSSYWDRHTGRKSTAPRLLPVLLCRDGSHFGRQQTLSPKLEPTLKYGSLTDILNEHYKF